MHPLVGLDLSGASLTPFNDVAPGEGVLGQPVWGPEQFLRDLELRLGLGGPESTEALRVMRWAARMDPFALQGRFYSASFELDRLGTASAVLALRDALVDAGWDGSAIPNGGARLDAVAELEAQIGPALPRGISDRVAAVARVLEAEPVQLYHRLTLTESLEAWSSSWTRVFRALELAGTETSALAATLPGAPVESDLGKVQSFLANGRKVHEDGGAATPQGDGTFVLLTCETSLEAAAAVAALLARENSQSCVVIRDGDASALDHSLGSVGLPSQGVQLASRWRTALQVLPLALELAFEPKDPYRVFELLSLPNGPFTGAAGRRMARALARSPGIGGRAWKEAKERLAEPREPVLERLAAWLEAPGADAITGAPKQAVLDVIERVHTWLVARVPMSPDDGVLFAAIQQCAALKEAIEADCRERFDLVAVRRLSEFVGSSGARAEVVPELAGRVPYVGAAHGVWVPRETVIWWGFGAQGEPTQTSPWRWRELEALDRTGIRFPSAILAAQRQAEAFRRAARAATKQLILVAPRVFAGRALLPHPLWDEIVAKGQLDELCRKRLTVGIGELFGDRAWRVSSDEIAPLVLPAARSQWTIAPAPPPNFERHSAGSLEALLACPLRWMLDKQAGIDSEGTALPAPHRLAGDLGHRLVEELFSQGAFDQTMVVFRELAECEIDGLFHREGAPLLRPGKAHEREQLRRQLVEAACSLLHALRENSLTVIDVERTFEVSWRHGKLSGRWDLLVRDAHGGTYVIDMKWGQASYKKALRTGTALQLAVYTYGLRALEPSTVGAAYFSLSARRLFTNGEPDLEHISVVEGPTLSEIWQRIERTVPLIERQLQLGQLQVTGLKRSLPLVESLGIQAADQDRYFSKPPEQICEYCRFDGLCGKRWEMLS